MPAQCCFFSFCEIELQRWTSSLVLNKMIQSAKIYVKKYLLFGGRGSLLRRCLFCFRRSFGQCCDVPYLPCEKVKSLKSLSFLDLHANCRSKDFHHSTVKRNPKLQHLLFTFRVSKSYLNYVAEFERCIL